MNSPSFSPVSLAIHYLSLLLCCCLLLLLSSPFPFLSSSPFTTNCFLHHCLYCCHLFLIPSFGLLYSFPLPHLITCVLTSSPLPQDLYNTFCVPPSFLPSLPWIAIHSLLSSLCVSCLSTHTASALLLLPFCCPSAASGHTAITMGYVSMSAMTPRHSPLGQWTEE